MAQQLVQQGVGYNATSARQDSHAGRILAHDHDASRGNSSDTGCSQIADGRRTVHGDRRRDVALAGFTTPPGSVLAPRLGGVLPGGLGGLCYLCR